MSIVSSQYYTLRFNDLSNEKQLDIQESVKRHLKENMTQIELMEVLGADPYDHDKPDFDRFDDWFVACIQPQIEEAWCELEVSINFYRGRK